MIEDTLFGVHFMTKWGKYLTVYIKFLLHFLVYKNLTLETPGAKYTTSLNKLVRPKCTTVPIYF